MTENLPATTQDIEKHLTRVRAATTEMLKISGGDTIRPQDLTQVRVPGSGGASWEIPGSDPQKTMTGFVLDISMINKAFYSKAYEESSGADQPDCSSDDGHKGVPQEGFNYEEHSITLLCRTCPMNEFGSAKRGKGKACGDFQWMLFLQEGDLLPVVIKVPGTSLKSVRQGLQATIRTGMRIVELGLERSDTTPAYSKITLRPVRHPEDIEEEVIGQIRAAFSADQVPISEADEVPF